MLRDRRELVEQELKLAKEKAAKYYLSIVDNGDNPLDKHYELLRTRVQDLQFDFDMLNELISQGRE